MEVRKMVCMCTFKDGKIEETEHIVEGNHGVYYGICRKCKVKVGIALGDGLEDKDVVG